MATAFKRFHHTAVMQFCRQGNYSGIRTATAESLIHVMIMRNSCNRFRSNGHCGFISLYGPQTLCGVTGIHNTCKFGIWIFQQISGMGLSHETKTDHQDTLLHKKNSFFSEFHNKNSCIVPE